MMGNKGRCVRHSGQSAEDGGALLVGSMRGGALTRGGGHAGIGAVARRAVYVRVRVVVPRAGRVRVPLAAPHRSPRPLRRSARWCWWTVGRAPVRPAAARSCCGPPGCRRAMLHAPDAWTMRPCVHASASAWEESDERESRTDSRFLHERSGAHRERDLGLTARSGSRVTRNAHGRPPLAAAVGTRVAAATLLDMAAIWFNAGRVSRGV